MPHEETEHRYGPERRDLSREIKENREEKENEELKAAAAMERVDYLAREVKSSQKQVQNIVLHLQAVLKAVQELRQALELPEAGGCASMIQDKKRMADLQKKILEYKEELRSMKNRGDLRKADIELIDRLLADNLLYFTKEN